MASNGRPPSRPPPPMSRPPPPGSRPPGPGLNPGPPPSIPPPPVPASPANGRKLSLQVQPSSLAFKRPPEKMEENKIIKFGDTRLRSPSPARGVSASRPAERKISAPPLVNYSPLPYNMNGSSDMQNFMSLLDREETDFVDQVKKSKAFIHSVIRDKHLFSARHNALCLSFILKVATKL